ncbi:hypothetical protein [Paenibacillus qinlingensis]|uniref:Uncharacterized protein n=1 Tax=Paenibacillus qinlingensis TaxID=1837343 RepID=A0ABU1NRB1_9BACL|nr:hypothetical protein [Paenibacillus qinlingensis]MDR6550021.1 hypothetical protein [Paenibacillus qinlingensis]
MKNKVGRPSTGRIGWWSIPLWEREREQRSIMQRSSFETEEFMRCILVDVKPIDGNLYIATCVNETLKLIDKRVEDRAFKRDIGAVHKSKRIVHGKFEPTYFGETIRDGYELKVTTRQYQNGYFNDIAMSYYLRAKVVKELVRWLNGDVDRGKWIGKVNDKEFPDLDRSYQPFVKFMRTVINKREADFFGSKLNLLTNDTEFKYEN